MTPFNQQVDAVAEWFARDRFAGIVRLYSPRQVAEQQGTLATDHTVARDTAEAFYERLRELFAQRKSITTFGPYSPGQAVAMKKLGIEGIYLGGWATSAKGSTSEDPGPDLASYPLSQVPDEAAPIVRALLAADRNQHFHLSRLTEAQRKATPIVDFRPFIIADADTGHGGDGQVRNLIRRFVEAGVPGYHIEDQKPGDKKCGHQGGKVLVSQDEQIKRLNTARFQLDVMGVAGIIVARTDAEAASLIDCSSDERDQPFILGAINDEVPSYRVATIAILRKLAELGLDEIRGHLLYAIPEDQIRTAFDWLEASGLLQSLMECADSYRAGRETSADAVLDKVQTRFVDVWQNAAGLATYGQAVADVIERRLADGEPVDMGVEEWKAFAGRASLHAARERAEALGIEIHWDRELARTPEGHYQIESGIDYAIARSLAVAPFADLLWMETKTADLADARKFAEAIHAVHPDKMLAYNLSPSFNWDTTGMSDDDMRRFPEELGKLGFVFNFITYGGHQIDGLAAEEFATALLDDGMLALARMQRRFRLIESPYRTPQTLVGGPRLDAALMASSGRTATTKAMGKGSTQFQHVMQTEVPTKLLESWLQIWTSHYGLVSPLRIALRPATARGEVMELTVLAPSGEVEANVVFAPMEDRQAKHILSVRDQNTFDPALRKKRLMTLTHLWLIHRYRTDTVHYVSPTEDNRYQALKMKTHGLYREVHEEIGDIIVANVSPERVRELLQADRAALGRLIRKEEPIGSEAAGVGVSVASPTRS
jgi:isocitrate lyase